MLGRFVFGDGAPRPHIVRLYCLFYHAALCIQNTTEGLPRGTYDI